MASKDIIQLSEDLLLNVKMGKETAGLMAELADVDYGYMQTALINDRRKKAFWINCYNAYYQILRDTTELQKPEIYREKRITIAGEKWSLDDIEHGILRRYRNKYTKGFMPQLFVKKHIKDHAVNQLDYRIHFALNCGAKSCPPISFYDSDGIEHSLDVATLSFIKSETEVDEAKKEIHVTALFSWFKADFGGERGIRLLLEEKLGIKTEGYKIVYKDYSWDDDLGNFKE